MALSCFGNFTTGELAQIQSLSFQPANILASLEAGVIKEPCSIPGFNPPNLPDFALPPIPIFSGIPPFPTFCYLPPFPGIPALSLPAISIPIPPLPFIPPIPLPILGFSFPLLPNLPSFDLGSLSFICGLLNIDLPVLDPFAFLNALIDKLNAGIGNIVGALNDFLNFCKDLQEAKNATEVPFENPPSKGSGTTSQVPPGVQDSNIGGVSVPVPVQGEQRQQTTSQTDQESASIDLSCIVVDPNQPSEDLAMLLADKGQIPADGSLINKLGSLLAGRNAGDLTQEEVQDIVNKNGIPSPSSFVGFQTNQVLNCVGLTAKEMLDCLSAEGLLSDNKNVQDAAFNVLKGLSDPSALEIATALNTQGVPYGNPATNLARITEDDIERAFFLKQTDSPLTGRKIVNVLVQTGIIDQAGENVNNAIGVIEELPSPLTSTSLEASFADIIPGPARGSLKAACIAATQGINTHSLIEINNARSQVLLQGVSSFQETTFAKTLSGLTLASFRRIFRDTNLSFPISLHDLIPLLSIEFETDDAVFLELFSLFNISGVFNDIDGLFSALKFIADSVSSQQAATRAIQNCESIKEGDFNFDKIISAIDIALQKFNITFPTDEESNKSIANTLKIELGFSYSKTLEALGPSELINIEELSFLLLATGAIANSNLIKSQQSLTSSAQAALESALGSLMTNPIKISIKSPTRIVGDINQESINVTLKTRKTSSSGIISVEHSIIKDGVISSGSTVVFESNDLSGNLEITIFRVGGFIEAFEAIDSLTVTAGFTSIFNQSIQEIPQNLISTRA